jgi:hypothetical protein
MRNHQSHIALFAMNQLKMNFLQEGHQILHNFEFNEMNLICDCHFDDVNFICILSHNRLSIKRDLRVRIVRFHIYSSQIGVRTGL